jgi:hypothetical protein
MIHSIAGPDKPQLITFLKDHNLKPIKPIIVYKNAYRAVIHPKEQFKGFSTKVFPSGIHIILGYK